MPKINAGANQRRIEWSYRQRLKNQVKQHTRKATKLFRKAAKEQNWSRVRQLMDWNLTAGKAVCKKLPWRKCKACKVLTYRNYCSINCWNTEFE